MTMPALGDDEKDEAVLRLDHWLGTDSNSRSILRAYVDKNFPGCEQLYISLKTGKRVDHDVIDDDELPRFLVEITGVGIFEGPTGKNLRSMIINAVRSKDKWQIKRLLDDVDDTIWDDDAADDASQKLQRKPWTPGGRWAMHFVEELGFPLKLSGVASPPAPENVEVVERRPPLGKLEDFQQNLKLQLVSVISENGGRRCILRLPTGAGKTRIAVEAIVEYWKKRPSGVHWIVWIASKSELCEQAVQCFKEIWEDFGSHGDPLRIHRVWGSRYLPGPDADGIVVAGIDKLYEYEHNSTGETSGLIGHMLRGLGLVVIDEAHHAVASTYRKTLAALGIAEQRNADSNIPLVGLTATPFRTSDDETAQLLRMFDNTLLIPCANHEPVGMFEGWKDWHYMIDELTGRGILSRPVFKPLETTTLFEMDKAESEHLYKMNRFDSSLLDRVGMDTQRNIDIFQVISSEANAGKAVLFFGTNVNQALMMSKMLNEINISSAAVTGSTGHGARREYISMFKDGRVRVLCNYQVLTTGFDAPKTDSIIIARPTSSRGLYEQMVGRGLRGPRFGGTEQCNIITMLDNIWNYEHKERIHLGYEEYIKSSSIIADDDRVRMSDAIRRQGL